MAGTATVLDETISLCMTMPPTSMIFEMHSQPACIPKTKKRFVNSRSRYRALQIDNEFREMNCSIVKHRCLIDAKSHQDHSGTVGLICVSCQVIPSGSAVTKEPTEKWKERLAHIRETDVILRPSAPIQMEEEAKRRDREEEANALINHYAQVMSAGISALLERAFFEQSVPPSWGTLTKDELPKRIAESLRLYEEEKDKRGKSLSNRLKSAAKWIIACVVSAVVGFYVLRLLGLG